MSLVRTIPTKGAAVSRRASAAEITRELTALIERDRWLPGDRLPTEAELGQRFGGSRPTVRKALTSIAAAGLIESAQGKGWFVCGDQRERFPLDTVNAGRLTAKDDVWHAWVQSLKKVAGHRLEVRIEEPPHDVVRLLKIEGEEPLAVARRRIRLINGEPRMISTGWWPMWVAAGTPLAREGEGDAVDMRDPSPLKYAAQQGFSAAHEQNEIGARMPLAHEAETLGINAAVPVLTMHTTSWTADGRPLRCTADLFPAHRFVLTVGREP